jgi:hypothetical protein
MKLALRQINSAFSPANSQLELYRNLARSQLGEHVVNLLKRINAIDGYSDCSACYPFDSLRRAFSASRREEIEMADMPPCEGQ